MLRLVRSSWLVKLLTPAAGKMSAALASVGRPLVQFALFDQRVFPAPVQMAGARRSSRCCSSRRTRRRIGRRGPRFAADVPRNQRSNQFDDMTDLLNREDEGSLVPAVPTRSGRRIF